MSLINDLIQVIENDDDILLSKLIENNADLNTNLIYIDCKTCVNCNECIYNQNGTFVIVMFCKKCKNIKLMKNNIFEYKSFVEILFMDHIKKSINVLINSNFDFSSYHPEKSNSYRKTPLYQLFIHNDIKNFEQLAKKNIYLNTKSSYSDKYDCDLVCSILRKYKNKHTNSKYLKILFKNGLKNKSNKPILPEKSWIYIVIGMEYYEYIKILLQNGTSLNCQLIAYYGYDDDTKLISLLEYVILQNTFRFIFDKSKTNRIINFFIENGFNIHTEIYNKKLSKLLKKIIYIRLKNKTKTTYMICILHKNAKHSISDFFKTNPGLYKYIGRKMLNYII